MLALLYLTIMLRRHNGLQIGKRVAVGRTEVWGAAGNRSHLIADISPKLVSTQRSAAIMPFLLFSFALQSMPSWLSGIISMTSLLFCVSKLRLNSSYYSSCNPSSAVRMLEKKGWFGSNIFSQWERRKKKKTFRATDFAFLLARVGCRSN